MGECPLMSLGGHRDQITRSHMCILNRFKLGWEESSAAVLECGYMRSLEATVSLGQ